MSLYSSEPIPNYNATIAHIDSGGKKAAGMYAYVIYYPVNLFIRRLVER